MEYSVKHWFHWASLFFFGVVFCQVEYLYYDYQPRKHVFFVHGTFGHDQAWYQKNGDFYNEYVAQIATSVVVYSFSWSGRCSHEHRLQAAHSLARKILLSCHPSDDITLIGHSHGANVCIMAVNELVKKHPMYKIKRVISLATPVSYDPLYTPNMKCIDRLYHFFSFGDLVQPVFNFFERVFESHPRIWNIAVKIDGKFSGHSDLRSPIMVSFLKQVDMYKLENDTTLIHLKSDGTFSFECDHQRLQLLMLEKENFSMIFPDAISRKLCIS